MVEARLRVIYGDTDQMGVVYYANYLRYFEFSRSEFFRANGGSYTEMEREGAMLPVVEALCTYKASARYDEMLVICCRISELRRASIKFSYEVLRESDRKLLAKGHTVHACVSREGKPIRIPEAVAARLPVTPDLP